MTGVDYYEVLQVASTAEVEVIRAAYKQLAFKYHPDRNREPSAQTKMQQINEAYEVLADAEKRRSYDAKRLDRRSASNSKQNERPTAPPKSTQPKAQSVPKAKPARPMKSRPGSTPPPLPKTDPPNKSRTPGNGQNVAGSNGVVGTPPTSKEVPTIIRRPFWVTIVFVLYVILWAAAVFLPMAVVTLSEKQYDVAALGVVVAVVFLLGASLMFVPIGHQWQLPAFQRSIVVPLLGSSLLAALLLTGGAMASHEFFFGPTKETYSVGNESEMERKQRLNDVKIAEVAAYTMMGGVFVGWVVWLFVLGTMAMAINRLVWSDRVYQWLLKGSVLELLIAIPMHLVVRRRTVCCAGMATGMAIGVGIVVMFVALGPAVFFLFYRRYTAAYSRQNRKKPSKTV